MSLLAGYRPFRVFTDSRSRTVGRGGGAKGEESESTTLRI